MFLAFMVGLPLGIIKFYVDNAICDAAYVFGPPFVQTVMLGCRGRPNLIFVFCPKNDDILFFGVLFFGLKIPEKPP